MTENGACKQLKWNVYRVVLQKRFTEPGGSSMTKGCISNIKKFSFNIGKVSRSIQAQFYRFKKNYSGSSMEGLEGDKTRKAVADIHLRCRECVDGGDMIRMMTGYGF